MVSANQILFAGDTVLVKYLPTGHAWYFPASWAAQHRHKLENLRFQLTIDLYQPGQFVVAGFVGKD